MAVRTTPYSKTAAATAATVLAANGARVSLQVQPHGGKVWVNASDGTATSAAPSYEVAAGQILLLEGQSCPAGAVSLIRDSGEGSDVSVTVVEGVP